VPTELDLHRQISRLKRAPQRDDTWEGAIVSLPLWVDGEPGADPYRPRAAICVSTKVQLGHFSMPNDQAAVDETTLATVLVEMARSAKLAGYRPRRLRVRDEQLAAALARPLEGLDTIVELAGELPRLDDFLDAWPPAWGTTFPPRSRRRASHQIACAHLPAPRSSSTKPPPGDIWTMAISPGSRSRRLRKASGCSP
jgi:hypothetical protein